MKPTQSISFVGAPGTGKSTLAQALNVKLKLDGYDSEFAAEYARAYLRRSGPMLNPLEQFIVFSGATQREDELRVHQFVVADSASAMGAVYYQYERATNPGLTRTAESDLKLETGLHELRRMCRARLRKIDHLFLVPHVGFDGSGDPGRTYLEHIEDLGRRIHAYLDDNDVEYHTVESVALDDRIDEVMGVLNRRGAFAGGADDGPRQLGGIPAAFTPGS